MCGRVYIFPEGLFIVLDFVCLFMFVYSGRQQLSQNTMNRFIFTNIEREPHLVFVGKIMLNKKFRRFKMILEKENAREEKNGS